MQGIAETEQENRSQIRQLLDKTGCRRQTQLIATLYRSLGRLVR